MPHDAYRRFVDRLDRQNQFEIQYDPDAMRRAVELDGLSTTPARCNVIVAGTNGKGSIASYLHALCHEAGLSVGLYTSPHLVSFRERIRINGEPIPMDAVVSLGADLFDLYGSATPAKPVRTLSYFELTTLLALRHFQARAPLDVGIFEVGIGGRLDATNVVDADMACFGSISLDHQKFLGDTLAQIAYEKAGVCRAGKPAFFHVDNGGIHVLREKLWDRGAYPRPVAASKPERVGVDPMDRGRSRQRNREVAVAAFEEVCAQLSCSTARRDAAIRAAPSVVHWPGRQSILLAQERRFLIDGAHNAEAAAETARWLERVLGRNLAVHAIAGVSGDRDMMANLAPLDPWIGTLSIADHAGTHGQSAHSLADQWSRAHPERPAQAFATVEEAIRALPLRCDCIVYGSLYLVGDAYASLGFSEQHVPAVLEAQTPLGNNL